MVDLDIPNLDVRDVARLCRVSVGVVQRAAREGEIQCVRVGRGGKYRFRPEWVQQWVDTWRRYGPKEVASGDQRTP